MSDYLLHVGDCRLYMAAHQADMFDACITDPPYELAFMSKAWDKRGISFDPETWRAVYRVLKPGARLLAFGAPRTHHRTWCAIEDAGFVIEDTVMWLFGSGFPKHKSKLKPAYEPIAVARKGPVTALNIDAARIGLEARQYSVTGAPGGNAWRLRGEDGRDVGNARRYGEQSKARPAVSVVGRWPANVALDGESARALDEMSGYLDSGGPSRKPSGFYTRTNDKGFLAGVSPAPLTAYDSGGASRFFYTSKASRAERNHGLEGMAERSGGVHDDDNFRQPGERKANHTAPLPAANHHPTTKPVDLMCWLVRLVTQPGDNVLDPFAGSGTTGVACMQEGRSFTGIEIDADYAAIADRRIRAAPLSLFAEGA